MHKIIENIKYFFVAYIFLAYTFYLVKAKSRKVSEIIKKSQKNHNIENLIDTTKYTHYHQKATRLFPFKTTCLIDSVSKHLLHQKFKIHSKIIISGYISENNLKAHASIKAEEPLNKFRELSYARKNTRI